MTDAGIAVSNEKYETVLSEVTPEANNLFRICKLICKL